jgi:hypothetical protein
MRVSFAYLFIDYHKSNPKPNSPKLCGSLGRRGQKGVLAISFSGLAPESFLFVSESSPRHHNNTKLAERVIFPALAGGLLSF